MRYDTKSKDKTMNVLLRIQRAVKAGRCRFSGKALIEMAADGLRRRDAMEAIINARAIYKTLRSTSEFRDHARERLYVIVGESFSGVPIYTKGKLVVEAGAETFYFLVSSKRAYWS